MRLRRGFAVGKFPRIPRDQVHFSRSLSDAQQPHHAAAHLSAASLIPPSITYSNVQMLPTFRRGYSLQAFISAESGYLLLTGNQRIALLVIRRVQ